MATLSSDELARLADAWTDYATAVGAYRDAHARDLTADRVVRLDDVVRDAAASGEAFAEGAIAASFDDATGAYGTILAAIDDATARTQSLAAALAEWDRFARIATAALALAAAAASGPAAGIVAAAIDLRSVASP